MLAMPGCGENARLPKPQIVVSALVSTARAVLVASTPPGACGGARPADHVDPVVDADAEQQGQRDDVREIERNAEDDHGRDGERAGKQ